MTEKNNLQKNDFLEIEFIGKTTDGDIFDTNIESELKKLNSEAKAKPFVFPLGQGMFLQGVDEFLIGKEIGKHKIEIKSEKAFGPRQKELVQLIPMKIFHQHKLNPIPGTSLNFDGKIGKILSASSGRVMVDFNHPIAGKDVVYEVNVLKKLVDQNEKTKSLIEFLFRKPFEFTIDNEKKTITIQLPKEQEQMKQFIEMFSEKFKEILGFDLKATSEKQGKKSQ